MAVNRTSKARGKILDIPTAPTIGAATGGAGSASVAFTSATVGGPAFSYTALSNPGSITGTGTTSPITVSGLTAGTSYTFTVRGTNPSGNSEYTSASNSVVPTVATSYESIATQTVGAGSTSSVITFSSIPSTYTHLQLRMFVRATQRTALLMRFNNDSGSTNYDFHRINADGSTVGADGRINFSAIYISSRGYGVPATTNIGSAVVVDILDYTNTNKNKVTRTLSAQELNTSLSDIEFTSGSWKNTTAINRIDFSMESGSLAEYTHIALYGIKGA